MLNHTICDGHSARVMLSYVRETEYTYNGDVIDVCAAVKQELQAVDLVSLRGHV